MAFPEMYVLRHGETQWNAENRMQGALNSPLTDRGRSQAARQGAMLGGIELSGFQTICSPQGRAFETAAIALARHVPVIRTDDRLAEIGVGDWQGRLRSEVSDGETYTQTPDGEIELYERAPNGEGFAALEARCRDFLSSLTGPSVLITHGITSRMIRTIVLEMGRKGLTDLPGGQGVVFHLKNGAQKQLG